MKTTKINLDRPNISSEEIEKKQDLTKVLEGVKKYKPGVFKNVWFYGVVGASCAAAIWFYTGIKNNTSRPSDETRVAKTSVLSFNNSPNTTQKSNQNQAENEAVTSIKKKPSESITLSSSSGIQSEENKIASSSTVKRNTQINSAKKLLGVPNIGGIHSGSIKGSELMKWNTIESGTNELIKSFMIGYFNGTTDVMEFVAGNELSEKLKHDILAYNTGEMIFFTEMYSTDSEGKIRMLPSINLRILPN
jgi:hypothetical protein